METTFGERLKESRKAAKMSQSAAAKKVGVSQGLISDLENNEYDSSSKTIELAHLYKVSAYWLATGAGDKNNASLDDQERELIAAFRMLTPRQKGIAIISLKFDFSKREAEELSAARQSAPKAARQST